MKDHFKDIDAQLGQVSTKVKTNRSARVEIPESDYSFALMPEYATAKNEEAVGFNRITQSVLQYA